MKFISNLSLKFLFLGLIFLPGSLAIIRGLKWDTENIQNRPVVFITFRYGFVADKTSYALGILLSRFFVITSGIKFTKLSDAVPVNVRVHSLMSFDGGSVHSVEQRYLVTPTSKRFDNDYMHVMVLRLATPVRLANNWKVAYLVQGELVPHPVVSQSYLMYAVSGWSDIQFDDDLSALPWADMNMQWYRKSEKDTCARDFQGNLRQFFNPRNLTAAYGACLSAARGDNGRTSSFPGTGDEGGPVIVQNTNYVLGMTISSPMHGNHNDLAKMMQPFVNNLHLMRDDIIKQMHENVVDEFDDCPEFDEIGVIVGDGTIKEG